MVDPADDSVIVNSEAGTVYRWDLATNKLAEQLHLNAPRTEAYTPTLIGPDGTVYAMNNATLYSRPLARSWPVTQLQLDRLVGTA